MTAITVSELAPGDVIESFRRRAVVIAVTNHPIWTSCRLVVWRLEDGMWSFDALDPRQEVGKAVDHDPEALRWGLGMQTQRPLWASA